MATNRVQASSRRTLPVTRHYFAFPPHAATPLRVRSSRPGPVTRQTDQLDLFGQPNIPTARTVTKCGRYVTPTLSLMGETFSC